MAGGGAFLILHMADQGAEVLDSNHDLAAVT